MNLDGNEELLKNTIDSSMDMIQVFKAVRNEDDEIVDFIWILNNKTSEKFYGDVIGKSLLTLNPGVVREGIFDAFKKVVETGEPSQSVRHYVHEQFDGWFLQSAVKQGDGITTTTKDISDIKKAEEQLRISEESLRATLDSSLYVVQAFKAIRDANGKIIDFTWVFTNSRWNKQYGEMIGKSLLAENPAVVDTGLFAKFVQVTETGVTIDHEQYYSHEQFHDQWFHQSLVKMGDGFVMNTEDITARKTAEQEIQEKQALLESVLNNTESSIMFLKALKDTNGSITDFEYVYTNEETLKSVRRESLAGKRMTEEFPEFKDGALLKKYIAVAETGQSFKGEADINCNGNPVWAQVFAQKFADGILVTYFDITERKKTEQQLVDSKELLQTVVDVTIHPIAYHKAVRNDAGQIFDFEFQFQNKQAQRYALGDRTGQLYSEAYPGIKDTEVFSKYCEVVETGGLLNTEIQLNLSGTERWFHLMAAKLGDGLVATALDVTERKQAHEEILSLKDQIAQQAEDKYRMLFNSINEGFQLYEVLLNESGEPVDFRYLETNRAFEQQTGLRDVAGKLGSEVLPSLESYWFDYFEQILKSSEPLVIEDYNQATARWYSISSFRVFNDGRPIIGALFSDVTEQKQREQQQEFLLKLSDGFRTLSNWNEIEETGSRMLADFLKLDRAYIFVLYPAEDRAVVRAEYRKDSLLSMIGEVRMSDFPETVRQIEDETIVFNDIDSDVRLSDLNRESLRGVNLRAFMCASVRKGEGNVLWSFAAAVATPRIWTNNEVALIETVAERIWAAVERAKAEEALRESNKRFKSIANLVSDLLWDSQPDGSTNWYNQRWLEYTGQHFEEAIGWGWVNAIHPDDREGSAKRYAEAVSAGKPLRQEHRIRRFDGEYRWFVVDAFPLMDERRQVIKMYGAATDIHDRRQNEEALRESEERFRTLAETAPALIWQNDDNGENTYINQSFIDYTGRSAEQIRGQGWHGLVHPDEAAAYVADYLSAVAERRVWSHRCRIRRYDGVWHWFENYASPFFSEDGSYLGHVGVSTDVHAGIMAAEALRESEEKYRLQLEQEVKERTAELQESRDQLRSILDTTLVQMSILSAIRDEQGKIVDLEIKAVNRELENETGRWDLIGRLYAREYPGIKETGLFDMIVKAIETGEPQSMEYFYPHEGFQKWFTCMFVKFGDGVVATNMDISAQKQTEEERFRNYLLLQQSEEVASMGTWHFDLLTKNLVWSDGMYRLFDLEKGTEVSPEIYLQHITENSREDAERFVRNIQKGDSDLEEILEIDIAGNLKVFHIKASVVRNNEGRAERVLGVDIDISAMRQAEEKMRKMEQKQQLEIFRTSLSTLEEERHRISESLHNGIAQLLYAIQINLNGFMYGITQAEFKETKAYTSKLLTDAIMETRRISHELMPTTLEQFGLKSAIDDICRQLSDGTRFYCQITGLYMRMEKYLELAIYRTSQELMANVVKHAKATRCDVGINITRKDIHIRVSDDGQGMPALQKYKPGIGLASIRSKIKLLNGVVKIDSVAGKGTTVDVVIPQPSSS